MTFAHDTLTDNMDAFLGVDMDKVTLQDCLDNYKYKNKRTIINDGHIVDWVVEP